jgi:FixJ family two-component response regulator
MFTSPTVSHTTPTVFVVDDDDAVRRAVTRLIRSAGYLVECFGSAREFLQYKSLARGCACLVLDVGLPDLNGLELQREVNAANRTLPIVFLTGQGDIAMTVRAMKAGATDFLSKPVSDTELLRAIDNALQHSTRALAIRLEVDSIHERISLLTPREREVLGLLVEGRLNKQAACELGIAEKTIKVHRARVMEKMEVRSLVELVRATDKACIPRFLPH